MQPKFVNHLPETVTVCKTSVKTEQGFKSVKVLAIRTNFENKDECKTWVKARSGAWHPVEKFWWVPASKENLRALKELSFFKGEFYAPNSQLRDWIVANFADSPTAISDGVVYDEFSVFPEEPQYMMGVTTLKGEDLPQMHGWVNINSKPLRVLVLDSKPADSPDWMNRNPRQYQRADGTSCWCVPWEDPTDRWTMVTWPDADVEGHVEQPEPQVPVMMELKAIIKDGRCIGVRGIIQPGLTPYHWNIALSWCKAMPGRKWNANAKAWDIPISPDVIVEVLRLKELWDGTGTFQPAIVRISSRLLEELQDYTVKQTL
jgi:hypothetical protein